jgi:2-isopropylmalate synthase
LEWRVPYLPVDPADLGRGYDAVIRVNSQSGKGGIAYLLESGYGIELPRRLQIDFARHVQRHTDATGDEATPAQLWALFRDTYVAAPDEAVGLVDYTTSDTDGRTRTTITVRVHGDERTTTHDGVGPVEALAEALTAHGLPVEVLGLHQTSIGEGADSQALTLIEYRDGAATRWAAGQDRSVLTASLAALAAAASRVAQVATAPAG